MLHPVSEAVVADLRAALPAAAFRPLTPAYLEEPRGRWRGQAGILVAPGSAEEVAAVVRIAAAARVGIVPYGGGTGLVAGQVQPEGPPPILVSLERMRAIRAVLPAENTLIAEAGAILTEVQAAAEAADRLFPLSLASEGSARIGGLLATNAGGLNVLRYGTARELTLGLEAVLPSGEIWHGLRRVRKDNAGYDLRHLLIGSEGTLGIITAAVLRLFPRPARTAAALIVVPGAAEALHLLSLAERVAGPFISGFELIAGEGLRFLEETGLAPAAPLFPEPPEWMVLIELGTPDAIDPDELVETLFAEGADAGLALDGVVAQSEAQRAAFWQIRETIPEANRRIGAIASHDIALPGGTIPDFLVRAGAAIAARGPMRINVFGHLGDGNLHYNVYPPRGATRAEWAAQAEPVTRIVHDLVNAMEGSITAEHGIGRHKVAELERYGDRALLHAMQAIKTALDPFGIMNPGAVLRSAAPGIAGPGGLPRGLSRT